MGAPTVAEIRQKVCDAAFGARLVENSLRGLVAEVIVGMALGPAWTHCSGDWNGWDFVHADGTRIEVKQSAVRQTWDKPGRPAGSPRFDIRKRTGYYIGSEWYAKPGRHAHIYVFAYHPVADDSANHLDPSQWRFRIIPTSALPEEQGTIGLSTLSALKSHSGEPFAEVAWGGVREAAEALHSALLQ